MVNDKANEYFKSSTDDVNDSHSTGFWKRVNKLLTDMVHAGIFPLLNLDLQDKCSNETMKKN